MKKATVIKVILASLLGYACGVGTVALIHWVKPPVLSNCRQSQVSDGSATHGNTTHRITPPAPLQASLVALAQAVERQNKDENTLQSACSTASSAPTQQSGNTAPEPTVLKSTFAKVDQLTRELQRINEELHKTIKVEKERRPALKKEIDDVWYDLRLIQNRIDRTQAIDDLHTTNLKARLRAHNDQFAAAELGRTPYGRLSVMIDETREPLRRLMRQVPAFVNAFRELEVEFSAVELIVIRQKQLAAALVDEGSHLNQTTPPPHSTAPAQTCQSSTAQLSTSRAATLLALKTLQTQADSLCKQRPQK